MSATEIGELRARRTSADVLDTDAAGGAAIRGSALRTVAYAVGILLGLVTAPLLVRHLGVVAFGHYVLVMSLVAIVGGLSEGGLTAVGMREYAVRAGEKRDAMMRNLLGLRVLLTVGGVAAATAFTLVAGYERPLVVGTILAGLALLFQTQQTMLTVSLASTLRFGWMTALDVLRQVAAAGLILALVVVGAELLPFFAVPLVTALVVLAMTAALVHRIMPMRPAFDFAEWRTFFADTLPYAAATAINAAYSRIAIVVMSLLATDLQTGYFATSYRIVEILIVTPALLVGAVFPVLARAARDDPSRLAYGTRRVFEVSVILGVWFTLSLELASQFLIDVIAGDLSQPSVEVLRIQALAMIGAFVAMGCGFPLLSLRRHRELLLANVLALAVSLVSLFVLVPSYAARGAAVATVAAEFALAIASAFFLVRARTAGELPLGIIPPVVAATALAGAVVLVPELHDVARVALASVIYFGFLAALRRIPPEVAGALLRRA